MKPRVCLYEGPWVAERTIAARSILSSDPDAIHPVTREIILSGLRPTAIDAFAAFYKLEALRRVADHAFRADRRVSAADRSHRLFRQAGASRPNPAQQSTRYLHKFRQSARSLWIGDSRFDDRGRRAIRHHAAGAGRCRRAACRDRSRVPCRHWHCHSARLNDPQAPLAPASISLADNEVAVAVVGAHLSGLPLNGELRALGGRLLEAAKSAPDYRLYALTGTKPPKPGLLRVDSGKGAAIEVEVWGASDGSLRPTRRCRSYAAFDRHNQAFRRPRRERLSGRGGRDHRRTRYFELWWLARVLGTRTSAGLTLRSKRLRIGFVFVAHGDDMRIHRRRRYRLLAAQDRLHHAIVLDMRLGEPAEVAKLCATKRLHPRPCR